MTKSFLLKVIRNSLILGLFYFISNLTNFEDFCWNEWKSLIIFVGLYFCGELIRHYNISTTTTGKRLVIQPLIF